MPKVSQRSVYLAAVGGIRTAIELEPNFQSNQIAEPLPVPNDDVFQFPCPHCQQRVKTLSKLAGRRVKCPKCGQPVTVPSAEASAGPPQAAAGAEHSSGATTPTTPTTATSSAKPPTPIDDDNWLNLGGPAIADLSERQQLVAETKQAKERERQAHLNRQRKREIPGHATSPPADADTPASASPSEPATTQPSRSIFDDDLPELDELRTRPLDDSRPRNAFAEKLLSEHGASPSPPVKRSTQPRTTGGTKNPGPKKSGGDNAGKDNKPVGGGTRRPGQPGGAQSNALPSLYDDSRSAMADNPDDLDPEYRITCTSCGTAQYVRLSNKGMKIKCPDCYLQFRIPGPPPGWSPKKKKKLELTHEDMPLAAGEGLDRGDQQRSQASKILERARQQVSDEDLEQLYEYDFDTSGFVQRTFGFLKDPLAVAHIIVYAIIFAGIFALGQFAANIRETDAGKGVLLLAVIGAPLVGLLFSLPMLSGGIAVLEAAANGQPRVMEWPGFNLFENIGDMLAISLALIGSMVPGFLIGSYFGGDEPGSGRMQIAGMMCTSFAFFPVVLLSILDNGSIFAPLSNSVLQSFREASEAWAGYYLKTFVAFSSVMLVWFVLLGKSEILAGFAGGLLPLLVFFTCQQIGALAESISEHLSIEFVPPDEEDEEDADAE